MIPLGDDDSSRKTIPTITYALIALNILFFLLELASGEEFIKRWAFVPSRFLANPGGDFITIFTSMFMHGGWLHLLGNMLYLWIFGDNVEDQLGKGKYLCFYILCGIAATFAQTFFDPSSSLPNVGASGAIAGVLGAYILMFPQGKVQVLVGRTVAVMPAVLVIGFWFVLQFISGIGSLSSSSSEEGGVAYMAHIGGFLAGLAVAVLFRSLANPRT